MSKLYTRNHRKQWQVTLEEAGAGAPVPEPLDVWRKVDRSGPFGASQKKSPVCEISGRGEGRRAGATVCASP